MAIRLTMNFGILQIVYSIGQKMFILLGLYSTIQLMSTLYAQRIVHVFSAWQEKLKVLMQINKRILIHFNQDIL